MAMRDPAGHDESTEFWARQFAGRWYRGPAHAANDFRRFAAAYRVPVTERERVHERAQELLRDGYAARRAA